ncbi:initiation factor 2 [Polyplosphaeria fusca]|uniref:Translation initiation factor IF-2, mitochondrial n=1 Tax=Polyplosphaeria fusca TaxID=682080 RepID=A0A9P4QS69_9PLEO|nr:initiation factor 2 [Polyplosphaeria fusca]
MSSFERKRAPIQSRQQSYGAPVKPRPAQDGNVESRPRFRANLNARPPTIENPEWGSMGNLRRKSESRAGGLDAFAEPARTTPTSPPPRRLLDQAELDRLLSGASKQAKQSNPPQYTRLSGEPKKKLKCVHCGDWSHQSYECPSKPAAMRQVLPDEHAARDTAANAYNSGIGMHLRKRPANEEPISWSETGRRIIRAADHRRSRFLDDESEKQRDRYNEPARRSWDSSERKPQRRMMRNHEEEEDEEDNVSRVERKRQRKEARKRAQLEKAKPTPIWLPEYISVAHLASMLRLRVDDFTKRLEELGFQDVQYDHILNAEDAGLIAQEYNFEPIALKGDDGDLYAAEPIPVEAYDELPHRTPVVTIMGHVDHGKTTILDYIRKTNVAAGEFGGITQHIGAFTVTFPYGTEITFLDTPGHAAFQTMRARGAIVTDIVVLVVAADDSVMPQTVEAIKHAKAAHAEIIVAINKIDKMAADIKRVHSDLSRHGLNVDTIGGDVTSVCLSGKTGEGVDDLRDAIRLVSEALDQRADPNAKVEGWVLESSTKKSGKVATVLVRSGTLKPGDILVAGTTWTRVRSMRNDAGEIVEAVGPGLPVEVDGWREQPIAGDQALQAKDEQHAAQVSEIRIKKVEREQMAKDMEAINESRRLETQRREAQDADAEAIRNGEVAEKSAKKESGPDIVSFIVKGDVSGSVEAVIDCVTSIGNNEVGTRILRYGVGSPSEFDVQHAADAGGHIVNFNTAVSPNITALAEEKGVKIFNENIIYRAVESLKTFLSAKLPPTITQRVTGEAQVSAIFEIGLGGKKKMRVAGSKVRNGVVTKGSKVRVLRKNEVIFDGVLSSLKNVKKDVQEMRKDTECGISFQGWEDFAAGDKIQCYDETRVPRSL